MVVGWQGVVRRVRWEDQDGRDDGFVLPVGTVTMVLADQEGSSREWDDDPGVAGEVTNKLQALVHDEIGRHGGVRPVEQGEGDSFVAAFARASDAIGCAAAIQIATRTDDWPGGAGPRLRMGVHTGEVQLRDRGNYMGGAVNRCGRLRSAAAGGQTLLSRTTADLVIDSLPSDLSLVDLGVHRLRDLARPEQIFDLRHASFAEPFPPLRGMDAVANNLPVQLSSFVGRQRELAEVLSLLDESRLVTLLGAGGCGKTRLALQVGADVALRHADGAWFVDLAPLSDPTLVAGAVAAALSLGEQAGRPVIDTVIEWLQGRSCLVILDNCEHLAAGAATVGAALLSRCAGVTVLATSRHPLDLPGERGWRVPPLMLPTDAPMVDTLGPGDAVELFVARAADVRPGFAITEANGPAVAAICRRLDGIPLAIELAAARVRMLSPDQLAAGLDDRFRILGGGPRTALPRQQTLAASVAWSYDLLNEAAQVLLRRLSVFIGGFTLELAEQVCGTDPLDRWAVFDLLCALVDGSLVQVDDTGAATRYRMLETIRQYGHDLLATAGEHDDVADQLVDALAELAERAEPELFGVHQEAWLGVIEAEHSNVRAALEHSVAAGRLEAACRLAGSLGHYWYTRGHMQEGARWTSTLWEGATDLDAKVEVQLAYAVAVLTYTTGDFDRAGVAASRALALAEGLDDVRHQGLAHAVLGWMLLFPATRQAVEHLLAGVDAARRATHAWCEQDALVALAIAQALLGELPEARATLDTARDAISAQHIDQNLAMVDIEAGLMVLLATNGDPEPALEAGRSRAAAIGDAVFLALAETHLAEVVRRHGETGEAADRLAAIATAGDEMGSPFVAQMARLCLALAHADAGDLELAATELQHAASEATATFMTPFATTSRILLAHVLVATGHQENATTAAEEAIALARANGYRIFEADALTALAATQLRAGDTEGAEAVAHDALRGHLGFDSLLATADDLDLLAGVAAALTSDAEAIRLHAAAEAIRDRLGARLWRFDALAVDALLDAAAARLGIDDASSATAEGAAMDSSAAAAYATRGRGQRRRPATGWPSLTPTELDVVRLAAKGLTNPQIAEQLFVERSTVKSHLSSIFAKLGVTTRAELAALATRRGL